MSSVEVVCSPIGDGLTQYTAVAEELEQTEAVAQRLAEGLGDAISKAEVSTILIGLVGPLGAGKTAFVRGFVEALPGGLSAEIRSPTYALAHPYPTEPPVLHMDLYRLESVEEFEAIGGPQLVTTDGMVLIEWVDRPFPVAGSEWIEVRLRVGADERREIQIVPHGARAERWLAETFFP